MQRITFRAMGSHMLAAIDAEGAGAATALATIPDSFAAWEQTLSRFREDSDLSKLNRSQGRPVRVSDTLWEVVTAALQAAQLTEGLITPAVLPALEESGYARSFDTLQSDQANPHQGDADARASGSRGCRWSPRSRPASTARSPRPTSATPSPRSGRPSSASGAGASTAPAIATSPAGWPSCSAATT